MRGLSNIPQEFNANCIADAAFLCHMRQEAEPPYNSSSIAI
jgi:hypothetical protein